ncbi:MAG: class I mannose-6-phosphate isomerase [Bryobacteraceae bacterium]|jgi:mannose-6-phosphate isomerase
MAQSPVRLGSDFKEKVWGSSNLEPWYASDGRLIGEVWFTHSQPLPLLVKFIFTEENLSVQVHPNDAFAGEHEHSRGKTEMWHILRAAPGARVAMGFREEISRKRLREAAVTGEIMELLNWVDAHPGDTFFIPAGTVHAIGAGLALCEVQQQSDVTYRLYDYGRGRELHLDKGVAVSHTGGHPGYARRVALPGGSELLAECEYFRTELRIFADPIEHCPNGRAPEILVFLRGAGSIADQPFRLGEAWLIPAEGPVTVGPDGEVAMLRTFVPPCL